MSIDRIYPQGSGIIPIYPFETDKYLSDLAVDIPSMKPKNQIKMNEAALAQLITDAGVEVRDIETSRKRIEYLLGQLVAWVSSNPNQINELPENLRLSVLDLLSRAAIAEDNPNIQNTPGSDYAFEGFTQKD